MLSSGSNAWLPLQGSLHAFVCTVPLRRFIFCSFLHGAPKQCEKIAAQLRLYEHLCGTVQWKDDDDIRNTKDKCLTNKQTNHCSIKLHESVYCMVRGV